MNQSRSNKVAAGIISAIILALLLSTIITYTSNSKLKALANEEKLQAEKLLSEKLLLKKQIEGFRKEMADLKGFNKETDLLLEKANRNLTEKEARIHKLSKEAVDAKQISAQLSQIKAIRDKLMAEIGKLQNDNKALIADNRELKDKNNELTKTNKNLEVENKNLAQQLKEKSFTGTNFKVEVIKSKKDKLTVKAKRTEKVRIEFEIAANTFPADPTFIHVDILSPEKKLPAGETDVKVENASQVSASLTQNPASADPQKVIVEYTPKEKLNQGVYTAILYHKNIFLGKVQFRLMK